MMLTKKKHQLVTIILEYQDQPKDTELRLKNTPELGVCRRKMEMMIVGGVVGKKVQQQ